MYQLTTPSLERLHAKLNKCIKLVVGYTEIPCLEFVIKACRLKPCEYVFSTIKPSNKTVLYRQWMDEFGNTLSINKNKKIKILYNDLSLDKKKIICTDLYYGLSLERIAKMSTMIHLISGKDEDLYQDCYLLTFLGIDEHLRSYLYWYGEWQQVSSLIMGMSSLQLLAEHLDIKQFVQLEKKENNALPCLTEKTQLSCLPAPTKFAEQLAHEHEMIAKIIGVK